VYTHIEFANQLLDLARGAGISNSNTFIRQVRSEMPDLLKDKVTADFQTWTQFCEAITNISTTYIKEGAVRLERQREETSTHLACIRRLEEAHEASMASLSHAMATTYIARGNPVESPTSYKASSTPYRQTTTVRRTTTEAGGFRYPDLNEAQRRALEQWLDSIPMAEDSEAGREEYRRQVAAWEEKHGRDARVDHEKPFPLLPGGAKVCTGECFKCGTNGHVSSNCPLPTAQWVNPRERGWRRLCQFYLRSFRKDALPGVFLVEDVEVEQGKGQGPSAKTESDVISLYSVDDRTCEPFQHEVQLTGRDGSVTLTGLWDDGAMVPAISFATYEWHKDKLGPLRASQRRLRMANGAIVPSRGAWHGTVRAGSVGVFGSFEIFDSQGGWDCLIGKPLLRDLEAIHSLAKARRRNETGGSDKPPSRQVQVGSQSRISDKDISLMAVATREHEAQKIVLWEDRMKRIEAQVIQRQRRTKWAEVTRAWKICKG
ncbi:hypothetical protein EV360DRAFT_77084, partial [Lentinula raphanica]